MKMLLFRSCNFLFCFHEKAEGVQSEGVQRPPSDQHRQDSPVSQNPTVEITLSSQTAAPTANLVEKNYIYFQYKLMFSEMSFLILERALLVISFFCFFFKNGAKQVKWKKIILMWFSTYSIINYDGI